MSARRPFCIPDRCDPLVRDLVRQINAKQATMADVEQRSGVPYLTIRNWIYEPHRDPKLSNIRAVLESVGLRLVVEEVER